MNFKIKPLFTAKDIQKDVEKHMDAFHRTIIRELDTIGHKWASEARAKAPQEGWHRDVSSLITASKLAGGTFSLAGGGSFNDQTGNLRSSIGYIIFHNGQRMEANFQVTAGGDTGVATARTVAETIAQQYPRGYALIFVAGMEYAAFVEAKGYDVITGSTLNANSDMNKVWSNVKRALKK